MSEEGRRLKVVQFIHGLLLGGAETIVKEYALNIDKMKFDLTVLCISRCNTPYDRMLADSGIHVEYISDKIEPWDVKGFFSLLIRKARIYFQIRKTLRDLNPDVIHYHLDLSSYLLFSSLPSKIRFFYTQHYPVQNIKDDGLFDYLCLKRMAKKESFRPIVLNEQMRRDFNDVFGTNNAIVLNNGVDVARFQKAKQEGFSKESLGIPGDSIVVGHVGRFSPEKNQGFLLDVVYEMRKHMPRIHLVLVGEGPDELAIKEKIRRLGISDNVTILSRRDDIPWIMSIMNLVVFPSLFEGLGIVVVESQVAGVPCLVSEAVPDEALISNIVFRCSLSEGPLVWSEKALDVLDNKMEVEYRGLDEWSIPNVVRKLESLYEDGF